MKPITRTITLFTIGAGLLALPFFFRGVPAAPVPPPVAPIVEVPVAKTPPSTGKRRIQVALLLDTSSSMDGLIGQAKSQLWKIVNELSAAKRDGVRPELEIAVYEYGKDSLAATDGYIRLVLPLSADLDKVSEELFALTTNGGQEYCGKVIKVAADNLEWSNDPNDLKLIFIAGNEPFTQGDVDYREAIKLA